MSDSARSKAALRRWMKQVRSSIPVEDARRASRMATERILELPELDVEVVNCFVSFRREIETRDLVRALLDSGRTVGVPRIEGHGLECRRIRSLDDLVDGFWGVPTSDGERITEVDAVVTPGLAFTPEGERLGYGAGHYDRYLETLPGARTIGFAFEHQVLLDVPTDPHDKIVDLVCTDAGVHRGAPSTAIRVVGGAVIRNGKVLVARRGPGMAHAGWWEVPGGKVEPGETEQQALARELHEELGIRVEVLAPLGMALHPYPGIEVALALWQCRLVDGEPALTEHDAIRWIGADEVRSLAWAPADVELVEPLIQALG